MQDLEGTGLNSGWGRFFFLGGGFRGGGCCTLSLFVVSVTMKVTSSKKTNASILATKNATSAFEMLPRHPGLEVPFLEVPCFGW